MEHPFDKMEREQGQIERFQFFDVLKETRNLLNDIEIEFDEKNETAEKVAINECLLEIYEKCNLLYGYMDIQNK